VLTLSTPGDHSTLNSPAIECYASVPSNNYSHQTSDSHNLVHCEVSTRCNQLMDENQYTGNDTSAVRASSPSCQLVSSSGIEWHPNVQLNTDTHHSMDIQFIGGNGSISQSPDDSFTPEEHHDSFTDALQSTYQPQYFYRHGDLHSHSRYSHFSRQLPSSSGTPFPDLAQVHQFSSPFRPASNQLFTTTDIRHSFSHHSADSSFSHQLHPSTYVSQVVQQQSTTGLPSTGSWNGSSLVAADTAACSTYLSQFTTHEQSVSSYCIQYHLGEPITRLEDPTSGSQKAVTVF